MKHRFTTMLFGLLLLASIILPLRHPAPVHAAAGSSLTNDQVKAATLAWVDRAHIKATFGGGSTVTFFDRDITDGEYDYAALDYDPSCYAHVKLDSHKSSAGQPIPETSTGKLDIDIRGDSSGSINPNTDCHNTSPGVFSKSISDVASNCPAPLLASSCAPANTFFAQTDANTIANVDGDTKWVFTKSAVDPSIYVQNNNNDGCPNIIVAATNTMRMYELIDHTDSNSGTKVDSKALHLSQTCYLAWNSGLYGNSGLYLAKDYPLGSSSLEIGDGGGTQTKTDGTTADNSCEAKAGALGWLECPVIKGIDSALSWADGAIQNLLDIDSNFYSNPGIKTAWSNIKNAAYIILVPIALVMVIGTALEFDFISAYTAKKALPRLIIAVIFISLSYTICVYLIQLFNLVGRGTLGIMTAPFVKGNLHASTLSLSSLFGGASGNAGISILTGIVEGVTAAIGLIVILWLFGGALLLFTIMAFLVLLLRQMFIVALLLISPLAILPWIFPNHDKLWKLWWGAFSKLLVMFPLIMGVIGVGRIFAFIIKTSNGAGLDGAVLQKLMMLAAYLIPYAFIPFTFKFAGGLFATLTGVVNDRSKGIFDKQREKRAEKRTRAGSNAAFNPNNWLVRKTKANNLASWAVAPGSNLAYYGRRVPGLSGRGQKIKSQIESATMAQTGKLYEELNAAGFNDKAYRALSGAHSGLSGRNHLRNGSIMMIDAETGKERDVTTADALREANLYGKAPTSGDDIRAVADIMAQSGSATEQIGANVLRGSSGRLGSLYSDPEMLKANVQAAGAIGLSAHGFASGDDLATVGNSLMKDSGLSPDLAQALVSTAQVAGQRQRPDIKAGYGTVFRGGKFVDGISEEGGRAESLIKTLSTQDLAAAKSGALEALTPTIVKTIKTGGGEATAMKEQLFSWAGPYSQASVDAKRQSLDIIGSIPGLQAEFDDYRRLDARSAARGGAAGGGGEDAGGGGGGGGGQ